MLSAIEASIIRPSTRRSSVRKAMPRSMQAARVGFAIGDAVHRDGAALEAVEAEQDARQLGRPEPIRPGDAQHLAGMERRRSMSWTMPGWVRPAHLEHRRAGRGAGSRGG